MPLSSVLLALVGGGLVFGGAALLAAALRPRSPVGAALAVYLAAVGEVVLLAEVLSPLRLVGRPGYLVGASVGFLVCGAVWWRAGRPRFPLPAVRHARRDPLVIGLGSLVALALLYELALVVGTPPNNWDSMTYHLPRAVEWYQRHGVQYYPAHTGRENALQPNGEIEILFTFVLTARETLAALPQLLAELALLVAVAGIARRLGASRRAALLAALVTASLTEVVLEATTTQNDLVTASFVVVGAYFLLGRERSDLALAGAAVGLALGTKATAFFALPILLALALVRQGLPRTVEAVSWAAAGFVALGLYGYALNTVETGSPLGTIPEVESFRAETTAGGTVSTVTRIYERFVDLSGYHVPPRVLRPVADAEHALFGGLGIGLNPPGSTSTAFRVGVNTGDADEDISFFGPLGFLLVLPLPLVVVPRASRRRRAGAAAVLALSVPVYAVGVAVAYKYNVWLGRFMITPVALTMPLVAFLRRRRIVSWIVAGVAGATLVLALVTDAAKPLGLDGRPVVWSLSHAYAQDLRRRELIQVSQAIDERVPVDARIAYELRPDDWTYILYGSHLARRLVLLQRGAPVAAAEARGAEWILLSKGIPLPEGSGSWFVQTFSNSRWRLVSCAPIEPLTPGLRVDFGDLPTRPRAERLLERAAAVGFRSAVVEQTSCRSFRVVVTGVASLAQAHALQAEALASGARLRSTIVTR